MSNASSKPRRPARRNEAADRTPEELKAASPRRPAALRLPWSPLTAIVCVIVLYGVSQALGGLILGAYGATMGWDVKRITTWLTESTEAQFAYILIVQAIILGGIALFLKYYRTSFRALGLTRPRWSDAGLAIVSFIGYFAVLALVLQVLPSLIPGFDAQQRQDVGFQDAHGFLALSLVFISLAVLPPLVEEIVMRGFLYGSLRKVMPFIGATIATSIVFGLAHLPGGEGGAAIWVATIDTFILSLLLCYLRERTGRLWAGIGVHAIKNSLAFLTLFILNF